MKYPKKIVNKPVVKQSMFGPLGYKGLADGYFRKAVAPPVRRRYPAGYNKNPMGEVGEKEIEAEEDFPEEIIEIEEPLDDDILEEIEKFEE